MFFHPCHVDTWLFLYCVLRLPHGIKAKNNKPSLYVKNVGLSLPRNVG